MFGFLVDRLSDASRFGAAYFKGPSGMNLSELLGFIPLGLFIVIAGIMAWKIGGGKAMDSKRPETASKKRTKFKTKSPVVQTVQSPEQRLFVDGIFTESIVISRTPEYRTGTFTTRMPSDGERGQVAH